MKWIINKIIQFRNFTIWNSIYTFRETNANAAPKPLSISFPNSLSSSFSPAIAKQFKNTKSINRILVAHKIKPIRLSCIQHTERTFNHIQFAAGRTKQQQQQKTRTNTHFCQQSIFMHRKVSLENKLRKRIENCWKRRKFNSDEFAMREYVRLNIEEMAKKKTARLNVNHVEHRIYLFIQSNVLFILM